MGGTSCGAWCRPTFSLENCSLLTKHVGDIGESACITRLLMLDYKVLLPFGDGHDFDLVYHDGKKFITAQVKVAWQRGNTISFNGQKRGGGRYDVDVFLIYFYGRVFCVPSKLIVKSQEYLGLDGHRTRCKPLAADYELLPKEDRWLSSIKRE